MAADRQDAGSQSVAGDQELFLCIDGGGTKTNVAIAARQPADPEKFNAVVLSKGSHRSSNYADMGLRSAVISIGEATLKALKSLPDPISRPFIDEPHQSWGIDEYQRHGRSTRSVPFSKIWAGLSGVDSRKDIDVMHNELSNLFGLKSNAILEVTNDCDILSGAIENHYRLSQNQKDKVCKGGIVLIAGTGSIATAFQPAPASPVSNASKMPAESRLLRPIGRLGGYGHLIGDSGSSLDVGRDTVHAILNYIDHSHRTERTIDEEIRNSKLLPQILKHFQVQNQEDLLGGVYRLDQALDQAEHLRKVRLAEVSRLVMKFAFPVDGPPDRFALRIMRRTADKLSDLLVEICEIHELHPAHMVLCLGGGMYGFDAFKDLVILLHEKKTGSKWGWVEVVQHPDQTGALTLAIAAKN